MTRYELRFSDERSGALRKLALRLGFERGEPISLADLVRSGVDWILTPEGEKWAAAMCVAARNQRRKKTTK